MKKIILTITAISMFSSVGSALSDTATGLVNALTNTVVSPFTSTTEATLRDEVLRAGAQEIRAHAFNGSEATPLVKTALYLKAQELKEKNMAPVSHSELLQLVLEDLNNRGI